MRLRIAAFILALLALFACDQKAWFDKFVPKEDAEFAKSYLSRYENVDCQKKGILNREQMKEITKRKMPHNFLKYS